MQDPIVCYTDFYPPAHWERIQELRSDDSNDPLWVEMTDTYHARLTKEIEAFSERLYFDHQTSQTKDDFILDPTWYGAAALENWALSKERVLERSQDLEKIYEESVSELEADTVDEEPASIQLVGTELPVRATTPLLDSRSASGISIEAPSTPRKSIVWAPLPDTTKPPKRLSRSQRLRKKLGLLRGLVCFRA